jgi:cytosine/adenosine deaminase-related metal-dependent hydrolase
VLGAEIRAAAEVGLRFHPTRGSMDLGQRDGGLPPDHVVESTDAILAASADAVARWHDPSPGSMLRVALAPCSPFSVTGDLMRESAVLARGLGVRLHTHLAETDRRGRLLPRALRLLAAGVRGGPGLDRRGRLVRPRHPPHRRRGGADRAPPAPGVAHCPSSNARLGAGIARTRDLVDAGARVGLGVDGAASNEAGSLLEEVRHAVLFARAVGGPTALSVREAVRLATLGGAEVLGRADELGSVEPGKLADLALWRIDGLAHADVADPVAALVLGAPPPLERLLVGGRTVVERGRVTTVDTEAIAQQCVRVHRDLMEKAS